MSDSDESEVDVCSIDDTTALNLHTGLTLVAAETYISQRVDEPAYPVPLSQEDLLTNKKSKEQVQVKENHHDGCKQMQLKHVDNVQKTITKKCIVKNHTNTEGAKNAIQMELRTKSDPKDVESLLVKTKHMQKSRNKKTDFDEHTSEIEDIDSEEEQLDTGANNMLNQFHFESDHMAIKNNQDYHMLLKTLAVLQAQKVQAIKDLEELKRMKQEALDNPLKFVQNLQEKKPLNFPQRQSIAKVPDINWLHYIAAYSGDKYVPQITTRKATKTTVKFEDESPLVEEVDDELMNENVPVGAPSIKKCKLESSNPTFNQKWTTEEQEKLEKLLILYPPEEVEARRWEKIAKALGNRTPLQVCSRIQKYFLKLAKAKLPIPGRTPTGSSMLQVKKNKVNLVKYKNSSFFPSWKPTVTMDDDDSDEESFAKPPTNDDEMEISDDENIPDILKDSLEYSELLELKRMKKQMLQKDQQRHSYDGPVMHTGFMCDNCNMDPIVGVRWHCSDCPQLQSLDFCNNCSQSSYTNEIHVATHRLVPVHQPTGVFDDDYLSFEQKNNFKYNYLDPNFLPSNTTT